MNNESTYDRAKVNLNPHLGSFSLSHTHPIPSSQAYGQSKLANVLFAQELAEQVKSKNILVLVAMVERKCWS